jgi:hypothetical protein
MTRFGYDHLIRFSSIKSSIAEHRHPSSPPQPSMRNQNVTAHRVGLTAAKDLKNSLFSGSFGDICGCFNLMARKIGTCGDPKANPVSSYRSFTRPYFSTIPSDFCCIKNDPF